MLIDRTMQYSLPRSCLRLMVIDLLTHDLVYSGEPDVCELSEFIASGSTTPPFDTPCFKQADYLLNRSFITRDQVLLCRPLLGLMLLRYIRSLGSSRTFWHKIGDLEEFSRKVTIRQVIRKNSGFEYNARSPKRARSFSHDVLK